MGEYKCLKPAWNARFVLCQEFCRITRWQMGILGSAPWASSGPRYFSLCNLYLCANNSNREIGLSRWSLHYWYNERCRCNLLRQRMSLAAPPLLDFSTKSGTLSAKRKTIAISSFKEIAIDSPTENYFAPADYQSHGSSPKTFFPEVLGSRKLGRIPQFSKLKIEKWKFWTLIKVSIAGLPGAVITKKDTTDWGKIGVAIGGCIGGKKSESLNNE